MNKSAKHTKNTFYDQQAVGLVSAWIAETRRAMPDLKANDKWPNIDGYVELTDVNGYPIGNVKIQIKKLSKDNSKARKHTFKNDKFLSYCRETTDWIPIIFIGVDLDHDKAYWTHISEELLAALDNGKTILFNDQNYIIKGEDGFVDEWLKISELYSSKSSKFEEYKKSYSILADVVTPALGVSSEYFTNIHIFLDLINESFKKDFPQVKKVFYPNTWKLGLAYYNYSKTELTYTLYPISYEKNDVQIKEIDKYIHDKIQADGLGFTGYFNENPIEINPTNYSKSIIKSKVDEILKAKLLNHSGSVFLAKEFFFAFIDKFHTQLGIAESNEYNLNNVLYGFNVYMPIWIEESLKFLVSMNRNNIKERIYRGAIDPDSLLNEIMVDERQIIIQRIKQRIEIGELKTKRYLIQHNKLPFRTFIEFTNTLQANNLNTITRIYRKRNFERLEELSSSYLYNVFTKEDVKYNIQKFIENVQNVFDILISHNFSGVKDSLKLWHGADKVLIHLDIKDIYIGLDGPGIDFIFLKSESKPQIPLEIIEDEEEWKYLKEETSFDKIKKHQIIKYKGEEYKINTPIFSSSAVLDFIYSETPMFDYLYKYLLDVFKEYFESKEHEQ